MLGGALAVGGGLGAVKLVTWQPLIPIGHKGRRPQWTSPLESEDARIAQLLRRATFGVTPAALDAARSRGFRATVDALLEGSPAEPPALVSPQDLLQGAQIDGGDLEQWWLRHMISTSTPFAERLTLFWHGHFTSSLDKVDPLFMYWQNLTWRRLALGKFGQMLRSVTVDPAMLTYLDLAQSSASDPAEPPNENYARELMELFTLGPGNYTEADVKAAARALAGWTTPPPDAQIEMVVDQQTGATASTDVWIEQKPGVFDPELAYNGEVTYLKKRGKLGLDGVVDQILAQPATAAFLAHKVAAQFISPAPAEETVRELANRFRSSGYDFRALMQAALTSPEFVAADSYRSLVKSPVELMVSAALALGAGAKESAELMVGYTDPAGQSLFQPPNVAGWPLNGSWISPSMMLARFNFVGELLNAVPGLPPASDAEKQHLDGVLSDPTRHRLANATSDRERWLVVLTSPEFNLK